MSEQGEVAEVRLLPMVDDIGVTVVEHGERGDLDPVHPEACLCGRYDYYLLCPQWGDWLDVTIVPDQP